MLCLAEFAETPTVLLIGTVFFFRQGTKVISAIRICPSFTKSLDQHWKRLLGRLVQRCSPMLTLKIHRGTCKGLPGFRHKRSYRVLSRIATQ